MISLRLAADLCSAHCFNILGKCVRTDVTIAPYILLELAENQLRMAFLGFHTLEMIYYPQKERRKRMRKD